MARLSLNVDFKLLFPDLSKIDILAWGAQECVRAEKRQQAKALNSYLGKDFIELAFVEMF